MLSCLINKHGETPGGPSRGRAAPALSHSVLTQQGTLPNEIRQNRAAARNPESAYKLIAPARTMTPHADDQSNRNAEVSHVDHKSLERD